jgi:hypothetical protein
VITTSIVIVTVALALIGAFVLKHSLKHAPVGFEDDHGFHKGVAPRPVAAPDTAIQAAVIGTNVRSSRETVRPRRRLAHVLRRSFGHGS